MLTEKIKLILALSVITAASVGTIYISGILTSQTEVTNTGFIQITTPPPPPPPSPSPSPSPPPQILTIEAYSNYACTIDATSISWGTLQPGQSITKTIYLKNQGNVAARLTCTFTEWNPSGASNYIHMSWNREGATINPGAVLSTEIRLNVDSSVSGVSDFSFKILINATA